MMAAAASAPAALDTLRDQASAEGASASPQSGALAALVSSLQAHHDDAFGWALVCCRFVRADAEDVLQCAYLKILDGRARFAGAAGAAAAPAAASAAAPAAAPAAPAASAATDALRRAPASPDARGVDGGAPDVAGAAPPAFHPAPAQDVDGSGAPDASDGSAAGAGLGALADGAARAGASSFRTFLFGVIRYTAIEQRRRAFVRRVLLGGALVDALAPAAPADADAVVAAHRARDDVRRALLSLPARQRELLELVLHRGLTIDDAARVMRISAGSARVHYDRAKRALRVALAQTRGQP